MQEPYAELRVCAQLVNLQSDKEFASHQLNRDTWSDSALRSVLQASFIFWQVCCPAHKCLRTFGLACCFASANSASWSGPALRSVLQASFIFWQVCCPAHKCL